MWRTGQHVKREVAAAIFYRAHPSVLISFWCRPSIHHHQRQDQRAQCVQLFTDGGSAHTRLDA